MLGDQLCAFRPIGVQRRALRDALVGQQQIDRVVNDDRYVGGLNRFKRNSIGHRGLLA